MNSNKTAIFPISWSFPLLGSMTLVFWLYWDIAKIWCCENAVFNMSENLENSVVGTGLEKVSFHSNPKQRQCQRMFNCMIAYISQASKVMLKTLQARPQQYVNHELPDVQPGFRKGRGTRDQMTNIHWITDK